MEEPERVPVFHSRLARTQRRRLLKPDGSSAGWLIINAADTFATVADGFAATPDDLTARTRETDKPSVIVRDTTGPVSLVRDTGKSAAFVRDSAGRSRDRDDPPQLAIPHPR